MINSLSKLLREVQAAETLRLNEYRITHGPTIGAMYEGLTKTLVDKALPEELDIRVVDGFVDGVDRKLSPQTDILVVRGEGERVPHTSSFIYPVQQVLAVFEVKKTLGGVGLDDAMAKMGAVVELHRKWVNATTEGADLEPAVRSFALTTGHWPMSDQAAANLPDSLPAIFDIFKFEQTAPLRIVWGYSGYKSEKSLRTGFLGRMKAAKDQSNFAPQQLPSLVVAGGNSLVKMVGQPYSSRLAGSWWNILTSTQENPVRILLEMLWTKISFEMKAQFPMDDTLELERLAPFIAARMIMKDNEVVSNEYRHIELTGKQLASIPGQKWRPEENQLDEAVLLMGAGRGIDLEDASLRGYAADEGFDLDQLVKRLVDKRQLAWTSTSKLRLIHATSATTFTPDGAISHSSNADLLSLWLQDQ